MSRDWEQGSSGCIYPLLVLFMIPWASILLFTKCKLSVYWLHVQSSWIWGAQIKKKKTKADLPHRIWVILLRSAGMKHIYLGSLAPEWMCWASNTVRKWKTLCHLTMDCCTLAVVRPLLSSSLHTQVSAQLGATLFWEDRRVQYLLDILVFWFPHSWKLSPPLLPS